MEKIKRGIYKTLRWSEKYTKTDMIYLTKGGFWLLFSQITIIVAGLISAIALANLIPKEIYGTYQFIMSVAVIISAFTLTGMGTPLIKAVAHGRGGALRRGVHTQLLWGIGIVIAGAVFATYYYLNDNITLALSFIIVGALSPFLGSFGLTKSFFVGKKLFREKALHEIWRRFIPVIFVIVTILLTHNPVIIILVYFLTNTLSAGLLYWIIVRKYNLKKTEEKEMINYGKHLSVIDVFSTIIGQADKILIFHFLGAIPMATYALALLPVKQLKGVFGLLHSLSFPKLSVIEFSKLKQILPRKVRFLLLIAGVVVIAYIFLAPFMYKIFFPTFLESIVFSQVLMLTLLSKPRSFYMQAFIAHHMKKEVYIFNISSSTLSIILLVILLPLYGIWGAVYTLLITQLYSNILIRYLFWAAKKT